MGKMNIIGCGGAGLAVANEVGESLAVLGKGFSDVDIKYIDTGYNNINNLNVDKSDFFKIETKSLTKSDIHGSGGDRQTHASDILIGVKEYLDKKKITKSVTGEFYFIIFSASGGSGSVIGTLLIKELLELKIPVVGVVIGDTKNLLYAQNTLKTLSSLHKMSQNLDKNISMIYVNNSYYSENGQSAGIKDSNQVIFNSLATMSVFLSGANLDIDSQDMINIINQDNYNNSNYEIPRGLYALSAFSKDVVIPEGCVPTGSRTLTSDTVSGDINVKDLAHDKLGKILEENVLKKYGKMLPLHLVTYTNYFTNESHKLKDYIVKMKNKYANLEIDEIASIDGAKTDEETGLDF